MKFGKNTDSWFFQRLQLILLLRTRAILRSLKNSLVRVIFKLHSKSCYYIPILINVCSKLQYAEILLIFLMSISYSVLAPLVIPFAVLYFGFGYVTWMNQLLFVYVPKWEGHGQMWPIIFHRYDMLQSF